MSETANSRTAKLKTAGLVSGEFHCGRCAFADLLIDAKVVQPESVIVVHGRHDKPDLFSLLDMQKARAKFVFFERDLNFMFTLG